MIGIIRARARISDPEGAMKKCVLDPLSPERVCWGCERYCPANDLVCGNGTVRTPHPRELFGPDWEEWAARATRPDANDGRDPRVMRKTGP